MKRQEADGTEEPQKVHLEWVSVWVTKVAGFPWENEVPRGQRHGGTAESAFRVGLSMGDKNVRFSFENGVPRGRRHRGTAESALRVGLSIGDQNVRISIGK